MSETVHSPEATIPEVLVRQERRQWVRYPSGQGVTCRLFGTPDDHNWKAELQDVSASGAGLVTGCAFGRGAVLEVRPIDKTWRISRVLLRVKHSSMRADGQWLLGCTFVGELSETDLRTLL
jgi:hypothetical protein